MFRLFLRNKFQKYHQTFFHSSGHDYFFGTYLRPIDGGCILGEVEAKKMFRAKNQIETN